MVILKRHIEYFSNDNFNHCNLYNKKVCLFVCLYSRIEHSRRWRPGDQQQFMTYIRGLIKAEEVRRKVGGVFSILYKNRIDFKLNIFEGGDQGGSTWTILTEVIGAVWRGVSVRRGI